VKYVVAGYRQVYLGIAWVRRLAFSTQLEQPCCQGEPLSALLNGTLQCTGYKQSKGLVYFSDKHFFFGEESFVIQKLLCMGQHVDPTHNSLNYFCDRLLTSIFSYKCMLLK